MHLEPEPRFVPFIDPDLEPWERRYAMWCHLGPLIAGGLFIATSGIAFFMPTLVALVLWLVRKSDSPFIDDHGREAVNFQISLIVLWFIALVVGVLMCGVGVLITFPLWLVLALAGMIRGAVAASRGEYFRYPVCIRFLG